MVRMHSSARFVQRLGLALVAAGLVAGAIVYATAASTPDVDLVAQRCEMREVERLGGTAGVQTVKFDLWLSSLWHGERLSWTLAVLGLVVGFGCWKVGELMGEDDLSS